MQITWKNFIVSTVCLLIAVIFFGSLDLSRNAYAVPDEGNVLKVEVVDTSGNAVHNAQITVIGESITFNTDNKGRSPSIAVKETTNWYDVSIKEWFCINLRISKEGYVDTFVFNCVIGVGSVRNLKVKIYKTDDSQLPYVCYVESPPDDYIKGLTNQKVIDGANQ
ncbi:MAG: hypothetical protein NC350_03680 [Corallococcus sp.]|nr:hypothetical protein [Corallococcus sp.]